MDFENLKLAHYRFEGRAGALQARGAMASMLAELGDNYATYHDQIADELERIGGRPDPKDFAGDYAGYCVALDTMVDLLRAERILRMARAWREDGIPLGESVDVDLPLVDERHRLVSRLPNDTGRASRRGDPAVAAWSPPRPPAPMDFGTG
jgi:hypothetical protein